MIVRDGQQLTNEVEIVWLVPAAQALPFVRETYQPGRPPRDGAPKALGSAIVVAYARPAGGRRRGSPGYRLWLARPSDVARYTDADGLVRRCPIEGVDPLEIEASAPTVDAYAALQSEPFLPAVFLFPKPMPRGAARIRRQHG